MVEYLIKSEGSYGFHEIIDFLSGSHIHYALMENPIIYKTISEASLRRHLKLADADDISSLPNEEIFENLSHMGFIQIVLNKNKRFLSPHVRTYPTPTLAHKLFNNIRRATKGFSGIVTPLFDTMLNQPQGEASSTSPSRISSSPSLPSHHTISSTPSTPPST
ncbi:hypothetical protein Tco_1234466 [Tanacetum coccineum]